MTVFLLQNFCIRDQVTIDGTSILSQPVSYTGYPLIRSTKKYSIWSYCYYRYSQKWR